MFRWEDVYIIRKYVCYNVGPIYQGEPRSDGGFNQAIYLAVPIAVSGCANIESATK